MKAGQGRHFASVFTPDQDRLFETSASDVSDRDRQMAWVSDSVMKSYAAFAKKFVASTASLEQRPFLNISQVVASNRLSAT